MRFMLLTFLMGLCILQLDAQTLLSGKVTDQLGPLEGCHITISGTNEGTYSNADGTFEFSTDAQLPIELTFSYIGYTTISSQIKNGGTSDIKVVMASADNPLRDIVVGASRFEERIVEAPVSIFKLSSTQLKSQGGADYYEAVSSMRGIQAQTSSLFLQSYNVRGFSDPGNFRFKQQIDGYDMTNPIGLAISNTMGVSDLDISTAELVHGASSALYGSDAFNGVLKFTSKKPF